MSKSHKKNNHSHIKVHFKKSFHTLIDLIAIVLIWRGSWNIIDTYLFPKHPVLSSAVGIIIGILIVIFDDFKLEELEVISIYPSYSDLQLVKVA